MDRYFIYIDKFLAEADNESLLSASNFFALFAIIISGLAIYVAYVSIFKSKVLDIKFHKFETLCIKNIDSILSPIDSIFQDSQSLPISNFRAQITDTVLDLQYFLISMKESLYPEINLNELILTIEVFTDNVYSNNMLVINNKNVYVSTKLKLFQLLYKYASLNEFKMKFTSTF